MAKFWIGTLPVHVVWALVISINERLRTKILKIKNAAFFTELSLFKISPKLWLWPNDKLNRFLFRKSNLMRIECVRLLKKSGYILLIVKTIKNTCTKVPSSGV